MKQLFSLLIIIVAHIAYTQSPQSIPYQAVVRNTDGAVLSNTNITMTFKIHDISATGTVVYEESHTTSSNAQGLVAVNVGGGSPITGTFNTINWGNGAKFLHVLMNAGNGVVDLGTQQMMSVPYALYAEKSNTTNVFVSDSGDTLFFGSNVYVLIPGISSINQPQTSNGASLLPYAYSCKDEVISVSGCEGQDSLLYFDQYYDLVEINGQCWFAENLGTLKFNDGTDLSSSINNNYHTQPCYHISNEVIEGTVFYNGVVVVDDRNICPVGWHVPSDCEWMYLERFLEIPYWKLEEGGMRGYDQGYKLMNSPDGWMSMNGGYLLPYTPSFNTIGFNALPVGRYNNLTQGQIQYEPGLADWFSSTFISYNNGNQVSFITRAIYGGSGGTGIDRSGAEKYMSRSIRCIKD
jgi:uncharacterized protein (TIGR02145 family)